jgi:hypothetical protein
MVGFRIEKRPWHLSKKKTYLPEMARCLEGDLEDVHWHKTSLKIYVLEGCFETKDVASGQLLTAIAGNLISVPSKTLHAARCPLPAKYVVGFESEDAARSFRPEDPSDL